MTDPTPAVITSYFAAQSTRSFDALIPLFTEDAVVVDEGKTWSGKNGIRTWRDTAASVYKYTTVVRDIRATGGNNFVAQVHLEGNFPGGTVDLDYRFTLHGNRIERLVID